MPICSSESGTFYGHNKNFIMKNDLKKSFPPVPVESLQSQMINGCSPSEKEVKRSYVQPQVERRKIKLKMRSGNQLPKPSPSTYFLQQVFKTLPNSDIKYDPSLQIPKSMWNFFFKSAHSTK